MSRGIDGIHVAVKRQRCSAYDRRTAMVQKMRRFYSLKRAVEAYRRGRRWPVKYHPRGHYLIYRSIRGSADYVERLRTGFYHSSGTEA